MKSIKLAFVASALLAFIVAAYVHTARANQIQDTVKNPARLIDFFPLGTVIDLIICERGNLRKDSGE